MTIGYDAYILNRQIALDLTFEEMIGTLAHCRSPYAHNCTLHGVPTWTALANGLPYLLFDDGNPDWLDCPQASTTQLDFTSEDFSMACWFNCTAGAMHVFSLLIRGDNAVDGWDFWIHGNDTIAFTTCQAGAVQDSIGIPNVLDVNNWYLAGITRSGASVRVYNQGVDITLVAATHIDPLTSNRELHIGIEDDETNGAFRGMMYRPRIWSRALAAWEWEWLFNLERDWFGV